MKTRPIIMGAESVQAILAGRKTQTRRVLKPQPTQETLVDLAPGHFCFYTFDADLETEEEYHCPYGVPGDRLWVRETWMHGLHDASGCRRVEYRADGIAEMTAGLHWRSPIYMPRSASRITLEVTGVRVERVQEISEADAVAEGLYAWKSSQTGRVHYGQGLPDVWETDPRQTYHRLWDDINAKRGYGWDTNPWVWVVEFMRTEP